jgi:hypothetical protein
MEDVKIGNRRFSIIELYELVNNVVIEIDCSCCEETLRELRKAILKQMKKE